MDWIVIGIIGFVFLIAIIVMIVAIGKLLSTSSIGSGDGYSPYTSKQLVGMQGEMNVSYKLYMLDTSRYFIINDLLFRKSNGHTIQIDHVVVSPYGVFVIETKNISGHIYGTRKASKWKRYQKTYIHGFMLDHDMEFDNPILQNKVHIDALAERMGRGTQIPYFSIIAFNPDADLRIGSTDNVVPWDEINQLIYSHQVPVMSIGEAHTLYENIQALNIVNRNDRDMHSYSARERKAHFEQKEKEAMFTGICPRCGGKLILRNGRNGSFYGCSNYPNCKYTHPI